MKKVLLSLVAAVLFLACGEAAARIAFRLAFHQPYQATEFAARIQAVLERQSAAKANERGASGRAHPYYGFVARDDRPLDKRRTMEELTASQMGFTGDTPLFDPSGKTFLVLITGGSVAHYFATDKGAALLEWLEKRPEFVGRKGRLLDTALPGYKEPQQLLILSDLLALGVRPDVVVNLDGFNEACIARKTLETGGYPFLPWFWSGDDAPSRERLRLLGRLEFLEGLRDRAARLLSRLPVYPALVGFPAASLDRLANDRAAAIENALARERAAANPLSRQRTSPEGGFYLGPNIVMPREQFPELAAAEWARASILLHDMVRVVGGRYFHALQPAEPLWAAARGQDAGPLCTESCVGDGYPAFARSGKALATAGIRFADLSAALTDTPDAFKDCCHMTPAGQEALFGAVTSLLARTWDAPAPRIDPASIPVSPMPGPFSRADLLAAREPGDLTTEHLRPVEQSSEGPYRTALGREVTVNLPLATATPLTLAFGLKNPLPGQTVTVRLNGNILGEYALDKPDTRLQKTLTAQFLPGLNTLSFLFGKANDGPDRNKDIPPGYAAQFTTLSLEETGGKPF